MTTRKTPDRASAGRPDFSAVPAALADANQPLNPNATLVERILPAGHVFAAEMTAAERALVGRVRAALLCSAEASMVPLCDTSLVFGVDNHIGVLCYAVLTRADSVEPFANVGVLPAKSVTAVLAAVDRRLFALREARTPYLADEISH